MFSCTSTPTVNGSTLNTLSKVELAACEVSLGDRRIVGLRGGRLSTLEARLLGFFASRPGESFSRDELLKHVWGYERSRSHRAVDVAMHRLRAKVEADPTAPRNLITVQGDGYAFMPTTSTPKASRQRVPVSPAILAIPRWFTSFVGRSREIAALDGLLVSAGELVLVTGAPGVGKSRLVQQVALRRPTATVAWVDLSNTRDIPTLLAKLDEGGHVESAAASDDAARLDIAAETFRSRGVTLLVLDNVDQVASGLAEALSRWRSQLPLTDIVLTSRRAGTFVDSTRVSVAPLPEAAAMQLLLDRLPTEAALQSERLRATLVAALDGLPLAVELAAARAGTMTLPDLVARLDQPFRLLRQRSQGEDYHGLGDAIAWSLAHLSADCRVALNRMSVFRAAFGLDAAEEVLALPADSQWLPDIIVELVDASVIEQAAPGPDGESRYRILRTIRGLAEQQLGQKRRKSLRNRHAVYCARVARSLRIPPTGVVTVETMRVLEEIGFDLLHALECAVRTRPGSATPLAVAIDAWWSARGSAEGRERIVDQALNAIAEEGDDASRAVLLLARGRARFELGKYGLAVADLDGALALVDDGPPSTLAAAAHAERAMAHEINQEPELGILALERARSHAADAGDVEYAAVIDAQWVLACRATGKHASEPQILRDTLAAATDILERGADRRSAVVAMVLQLRGLIYEGNWAAARPMRRRARRMAIEEALPFQLAHLEAHAALEFEFDSDYVNALDSWQASMGLIDRLGQKVGVSAVRARRAWALIELGRLDEAHQECLAALGSVDASTSPLLLYYANVGLAMVALEQSNPARAVRSSGRAVEAASGYLRDRAVHARAIHALSLAAANRPTNAEDELHRARVAAAEHDHPQGGLITAMASVLLSVRYGDRSLAEGSPEQLRRYASRLLEEGAARVLVEQYERFLAGQPLTVDSDQIRSSSALRWLQM